MKFAHNIKIRSFENDEEFDLNNYFKNLNKLLPEQIKLHLDEILNEILAIQKVKVFLEKQKCELSIEEMKTSKALQSTRSSIIDGNDLIKVEFVMQKDKHINDFLEMLKENLGKEQCNKIISEENRVDDECNLFIRLEKKELIENNKFVLTDKGDCFHLKIKLAAYPSKKEIALKIVKEIFSN